MRCCTEVVRNPPTGRRPACTVVDAVYSGVWCLIGGLNITNKVARFVVSYLVSCIRRGRCLGSCFSRAGYSNASACGSRSGLLTAPLCLNVESMCRSYWQYCTASTLLIHTLYCLDITCCTARWYCKRLLGHCLASSCLACRIWACRAARMLC